ncbi:hypothetical protein [Bacillus sp. JJ722]|uniref:hypothetical protein n=1 Tax=Bacillus sp. JJ722 TaxID=3122973 RepID=UPI002FFD68F0
MRKLSIILGLFFLVACSNENVTQVNKDDSSDSEPMNQSKEMSINDATQLNKDVNFDSEPMSQSKEIKITKEFVEKNIMIGFSYDEIRKVFGNEQYSWSMDNTMNFLYDSTNYKPFVYNQGADSVAHNEINSGKLDYQLYIKFIDGKSNVYSYFYKGKNSKIWQYQANPDSSKLVETPVSGNIDNNSKHTINKNYPQNRKGQTYGSEVNAPSYEDRPDLISAVGIDGTTGYVKKEDFDGPQPRTPEEAVKLTKEAKPREIPLYDVDGETIIGKFIIGG